MYCAEVVTGSVNQVRLPRSAGRTSKDFLRMWATADLWARTGGDRGCDRPRVTEGSWRPGDEFHHIPAVECFFCEGGCFRSASCIGHWIERDSRRIADLAIRESDAVG